MDSIKSLSDGYDKALIVSYKLQEISLYNEWFKGRILGQCEQEN